ncbi:MAG: hypothetical protein V1784_08275 [bacterium]
MPFPIPGELAPPCRDPRCINHIAALSREIARLDTEYRRLLVMCAEARMAEKEATDAYAALRHLFVLYTQ